MWIKQSTAITVKVGPFVDETDGKTAETGLTISQADVRLSKNGGDMAQKNESTSCTHDEIGVYDCPLDATDTGTLGRLQLFVHESGALPVWHNFMVMPANVWDSLFGADKLQVHADEITAGLITAAAVATGAIDADAIADGAIDAGAIADNAITAAKIASDAITAAKIADGAIDAGAIASDAITAAKIADGAIDAGAIADNAITAAKIATGAIDADAISDNAIDAGAIAADAITAAKIADGAIDAATFASGAITAAAIAADAIGASELAADAVAEIADAVWDEALSGHTGAGSTGEALDNAGSGASASDIADAVWDELSTGHTDAGKAGAQLWTDVDAILADTGTDGVVIANDGITAAKIATGAIDADAIADNAIDAGAIASNAITAAKIATGAIDADALAADAVDEILDEVVEGTLTLRQVLRVFLAALAGKSAGGGTASITFRDNGDSKARITATVDEDGNRTAITLDAS